MCQFLIIAYLFTFHSEKKTDLEFENSRFGLIESVHEATSLTFPGTELSEKNVEPKCTKMYQKTRKLKKKKKKKSNTIIDIEVRGDLLKLLRQLVRSINNLKRDPSETMSGDKVRGTYHLCIIHI